MGIRKETNFPAKRAISLALSLFLSHTHYSTVRKPFATASFLKYTDPHAHVLASLFLCKGLRNLSLSLSLKHNRCIISCTLSPSLCFVCSSSFSFQTDHFLLTIAFYLSSSLYLSAHTPLTNSLSLSYLLLRSLRESRYLHLTISLSQLHFLISLTPSHLSIYLSLFLSPLPTKFLIVRQL